MAKLKLDYDWYPLAKFMEQATAAHKFNGTEHALLSVVRDMTFGEPDYSNPGERLEKAPISLREFQKRTGRGLANIRKSLKALEDAKVIERHGVQTNKDARIYGYNTKIDTWKVERIGEILETSYPGGKTPKRRAEKSNQGAPIGVLQEQQSTQLECSNSDTPECSRSITPECSNWSAPPVSEPNNGEALRPTQESKSKREEDPPLPPRGDSRGGETDEEWQFAQAVFQRIKSQWNGITGSSSMGLEFCRDLTERYRDNLKPLKRVFFEAFSEQKATDERTKTVCFKPFKILDATDSKMRTAGFKPLAPRPRDKLYIEDGEPPRRRQTLAEVLAQDDERKRKETA